MFVNNLKSNVGFNDTAWNRRALLVRIAGIGAEIRLGDLQRPHSPVRKGHNIDYKALVQIEGRELVVGCREIVLRQRKAAPLLGSCFSKPAFQPVHRRQRSQPQTVSGIGFVVRHDGMQLVCRIQMVFQQFYKTV